MKIRHSGLLLFLGLTFTGEAALAVARGNAVPREILGPAWSLLARATRVEVTLLERRPNGQFKNHHGLAAVAKASPGKRWLRRFRALLRSPRSYFKPKCDAEGVCPRLKCKTTPRAVVSLSNGKQSAEIVITVCHTLQAGPSLDKLRPQVSMEPAEGKLLRLLQRLFPKDAKLREDLAEWKASR